MELKEMQGVGKATQKKFNEAGVADVAALAQVQEDDVAELAEAVGKDVEDVEQLIRDANVLVLGDNPVSEEEVEEPTEEIEEVEEDETEEEEDEEEEPVESGSFGEWMADQGERLVQKGTSRRTLIIRCAAGKGVEDPRSWLAKVDGKDNTLAKLEELWNE